MSIKQKEKYLIWDLVLALKSDIANVESLYSFLDENFYNFWIITWITYERDINNWFFKKYYVNWEYYIKEQLFFLSNEEDIYEIISKNDNKKYNTTLSYNDIEKISISYAIYI